MIENKIQIFRLGEWIIRWISNEKFGFYYTTKAWRKQWGVGCLSIILATGSIAQWWLKLDSTPERESMKMSLSH